VKTFSARGAIIDAALNAVIPTIVYQFAHRHGVGDSGALGYAAIYPALVAIGGIVWRRTLDPIAAIVLFGLIVSGVGLLVGGGPQILLIRESFVTGALGVLCFVSLLFPRPLMFYFGRWFATRGDREKSAAYDQLWERVHFRAANRLITIVWGFAFTGEFALRVVMAYTLPIPVVLVLGPVALGVITTLTILWTFAYSRRLQARAAAAGFTTPV
jgi:hypothetical protein